MKIIYSNHFPPKGFGAINLFSFIVARKEYGKLNDAEKNHEKIHTKQMLELLFIFFYIAYITEWLIRFIQYGDGKKAYYNISFEREAYANMYDCDYYKKRKLFTFIKYYRIV